MSKKDRKEKKGHEDKKGQECKLDEGHMDQWLGHRDKIARLSAKRRRTLAEIGTFARKMNDVMGLRYKGRYGLTDNGYVVPQYIMFAINTMEQNQRMTREELEEYDDFIEWVEEKKFKANKISEENMKKYQELADKLTKAAEDLNEAMLDQEDFLNEMVTAYHYKDTFPVTVDRNGCLVHDSEATKRQEIQQKLLLKSAEA